ncbi:antitoxin [Nocardia pseudobrasiliensis]|uniref:Antitoxin protein of toxin-antitoxin system n=1 Tax=Nocardia pseudobrasiliensis TaxID=45979 RepID=A0A370HST6_9NOCA|nr:antitoxin [Nocardia pseudobrasiliensis]RDI61395.1 antitoxin protein of toxin-antitoxin system [Nocardia pseudobrasiliensis]
MSLMDTLKGLVGKGREAASENAEKVHGAVDKAGGFINEKTGGKYSDQIGKGADAIKNAIPEKDQPQTPPPPAPEPPAPPQG